VIPPRISQVPDHLDILRGAKAIGAFINAKPSRVYALHARRLIPTFSEGNIICLRRSVYLQWVELQERTARHAP